MSTDSLPFCRRTMWLLVWMIWCPVTPPLWPPIDTRSDLSQWCRGRAQRRRDTCSVCHTRGGCLKDRPRDQTVNHVEQQVMHFSVHKSKVQWISILFWSLGQTSLCQSYLLNNVLTYFNDREFWYGQIKGNVSY